MQELVLIQPGRTLDSEQERQAAEEAALRREFEDHLADCGSLAFRVCVIR